MINSFVRREAELSSRIENTFAEFRDLALFDQTQAVEGRVPDVRKVHNNERAIVYGLAAVRERGRAINLRLIKEMHEILLRSVRGHDKQPGQLRSVQVFIGRSERIEHARFVPPGAERVQESMESLEKFIAAGRALPPLIRAAVIHYQFEAIHPFADGNGRIGRALILLLLCADGVLPVPLLNPSTYLEQHRQQYYDHLLSVSQHGTWAQWIKFFLRGINSSATEAVERIGRLKTLQASYHEQLHAARSPGLLLKLVDELFVRQAVDIAHIASVLKVTRRSAQHSVEKLQKFGIVREITGRQRNRIYLADGIIDAITK